MRTASRSGLDDPNISAHRIAAELRALGVTRYVGTTTPEVHGSERWSMCGVAPRGANSLEASCGCPVIALRRAIADTAVMELKETRLRVAAQRTDYFFVYFCCPGVPVGAAFALDV